MDENIIIKMVSPYVKDNKITYDDFEKIFDMLSKKEQYGVSDVLLKNRIELVDSVSEDDKLDDESDIFISEDDFEILYDESIFGDDEWEGTEKKQDSNLIVKKGYEIKQTNLMLLDAIKRGNKQAMQDLCIKNKALVDKYAQMYKKLMGNNLEFEDLEQAGMLGMIKAAEKFDFSYNGAFSTYAVWWIRQSIMREIMDHGFTVRIPVHIMEKILKVAHLESEHADIEDYDKRIKVIAEESDMPIEKIQWYIYLRKMYVSTVSLDVPVGEDDDTSLQELVPIEDEISVEGQVSRELLKDKIREVLSTLTPREQKVISMRFGLNDGVEHTLEQVGKEFNVTRERIRQIEAKALRKLRHPSRSKKLRDFLD